MNTFPDIYYPAAVLAALAASIAVFVRVRTYQHAAVAALTMPLILVYLIGMYRVFGVDFDTYEGYLDIDSERDRIPDIGYRLMMELAHALGMTMTEFFLLQALFTILAIYLLARKWRSDFAVTITLYILHSAIVRDFSQSRTALALAIYFIALTQERRSFYIALTLVAASVHLTLVPLVLVYHWARFAVNAHKGRVFLVLAPAATLLAGVTVMLSVLGALDPRIQLYMDWAQDLYGNPVGSYSTLLPFVLIGGFCYRAQQLTGDKESKVFLITILYAAVTFMAFSKIAIFAFRLSNVVAALYPFAVGRAITLLKEREDNRLFDMVVPLALLGALLLAVIIRPGSLDVLQTTEPALLAR